MELPGFWAEGDAVARGVALLLLAMSIAAWVLIFWKGWLLRRVRSDIARAVPAFWAANDLQTAHTQLAAFDREQVLLPLPEQSNPWQNLLRTLGQCPQKRPTMRPSHLAKSRWAAHCLPIL